MRVSPVAMLADTRKCTAAPNSQIHQRKPTDARYKKTAVSSGFIDLSGFLRKSIWCPEEDSNLHDLAIAST
jgi:hypothetical protein